MDTVPDSLFEFIPEKRCTKCLTIRPLTEFERVNRIQGGRGSHCKYCVRERRAKWSTANPEKNRESAREWARRNNPLRRELLNARVKVYSKRRRKKINEWKRAYRAKPSMLVETRLRNRFAEAMRRFSRTGKVSRCRDYGLDFAAIFAHIGPCPGLRSEWHIDHIVPCAAFDHTDLEEIKICWHPLNLRWVQSTENLKKQDRYDPQDKADLIRRIRGE